MKSLDLRNLFNTTFLYKSIEDIKDNDLFTLYDYDRFPRTLLKKDNMEFDFSFIKDKCILTNKQVININERVSKIALAGCSLLYAIKDKIKIIYEDGTFEYKAIKFSDYTWDIHRSLNWMFGKQRKDYQNFSIILKEDYNYKMEVLNYVYQYVIKVDSIKKVKQIILPKNELLLIFAITII